jgi:hypothetical protein
MISRAKDAIILLLILLAASYSLCQAQGIRPLPDNPFYWEFRGKPTLLLGGSVDDDLFQIDYLEAHLDTLVACGGNYIRNTMSSGGDRPWPFAIAGEKYDLNRFNPEYWDRLDKLIGAASKRDIVVQVEVWATFAYYRERWNEENPFNPLHNKNYTLEASGLPAEVNTHPVRAENSFFRTVPANLNNRVVLAYQQKYVDKLVSITLKYDNVLFSMDNETSVDASWGAYWAGYIKEKYAAAGRKAYLTEMWDPWDLTHPWHLNTIDHPETYNFVEVSQNTWQEGQRQRDRLAYVRDRLVEKGFVRPINNIKIYGMRAGNRYLNPRLAVDRFFVHLWGGCATVRFHRPTDSGHGIGLDLNAQRAIRGAGEIFYRFDIFTSRPDDRLLKDRAENEAYCLARKGLQWAVYFPDGGRVFLDAESAPDNSVLTIEWFDLDYLTWQPSCELTSSARVPLGCPDSGRWVALVGVKK